MTDQPKEAFGLCQNHLVGLTRDASGKKYEMAILPTDLTCLCKQCGVSNSKVVLVEV